jgi:hypothetical protein
MFELGTSSRQMPQHCVETLRKALALCGSSSMKPSAISRRFAGSKDGDEGHDTEVIVEVG